MGSEQDKKDLENFLSKVDNVDAILQGLISKDLNVQAEAIAKADKQIHALESKKKSSATEIGYDHSCINKDAYKIDDRSDPALTHQNTSQEAFMAALEADSKKRTEARKERHMKANVIKEEGNKAFRANNFEEAVTFYTDAMKIAKDLSPLYTNRAATYLKLEQYDLAIEDCDFALRIDEKWIKAHIYKAKALQKMHKYDEAAKEYKLIVEIDKQKQKMLETYLSELEKDKKQHQLETKACANLQSEKMEAVNIFKLIQTMQSQSDDQKTHSNNLMYFVGGFQVLQEQMIDEQAKTLFRTEGGFNMFVGNGVVAKCLKAKLHNKPLVPHCAELISAVVSLCTVVCSNVEENLVAFLALEGLPELLVNFLDWPNEQLKRSVIIFFHEISLSATTRSVLYGTVNLLKLSSFLFKPKTTKAIANTNAAATLCNLSLDQKYYAKLLKCGLNNEFVELLQLCLAELSKSNYEALSLRMRYITSLAENPEICHYLATNAAFYNESLQSLERCITTFKSGLSKLHGLPELLQLLRCLLKIHSNEEDSIKILTVLRPMIMKTKCEDLLACALHLVGVILEIRKNCVEYFLGNGGYSVVKLLLNLLSKDLQLRTHSLKILCSAGQMDAKYIQYLSKLDRNYSVLRSFLIKVDVQEEINQGHIALLFGALSTLPKALDPLLEVKAEGDVVRRLLVLCRESKNKQVCANCAIALGKLSVAHTNFLMQLRKHDGINILSRLKTEDIFN